MQNDPIAILGVIGGHFRRLSAASVLLSNGKGAADLMKMCGIKDYPARKAMEAARRFKPEFYKKASELILETDYRMKTSFDEPERLLELLVLQLAQEAHL
jgi:DNA polymerase III delta subunit